MYLRMVVSLENPLNSAAGEGGATIVTSMSSWHRGGKDWGERGEGGGIRWFLITGYGIQSECKYLGL